MRSARLALPLALVAALVIAPQTGAFTGYALAFCVNLFMYLTLAASWNLFSGFTGYLSFGHGVFFGIGCYTFGILVSKARVGPVEAMLVTLLVTLAAGVLLGIALLGMTTNLGFFVMITLGTNEIVRTIVLNTAALNGSSGINVPPPGHPLIIYYVLLGVACATALMTLLVTRSRVGLALRAVRSDEVAAEVAGVPTQRYKYLVFVLSSVPPGLAGGAVGWHWSYVDPFMAFDSGQSFLMLEMALLGGAGTVVGPLIGATFMTVLTEILSIKIPHLHSIIFGFILLAVLFACPGGLIELWGRVRRGVRRAGAVPVIARSTK